MKKNSAHIETALIHAGEAHPRINYSVSMPIFQTSTFEYEGDAHYHDIKYARLNNTPNHEALHKKLAALEDAEAALVCASGMAAISSALLATLKSGDHFLIQEGCYGGTYNFVTRDLPKWGIEYDWIGGNNPDSWQKLLRKNTKAIYVESISNPLLEVADLEAAVRFAREHKLVSMIDNTFASPVNYRPTQTGFDLVLHSCTKYLNGHSDLVAGAVIGKSSLVKNITHLVNHLGSSLDPHGCFLLHRGIKTLALRVREQNKNAQAVADFLNRDSRVFGVRYPGLVSHPQHTRARELFNGFGGILSFEVKGGLEAAKKFISKLKLPAHAPSVGGVESLVTRPAMSTHSGLSPAERSKIGISDELVRLSVGIEHCNDLIADIEQAL